MAPSGSVIAAIAELKAGDFQSRWEIAKQLRELGLEAVPALIDLMHDQSVDWEIRWFAVRILGEFDQPPVVMALAQLLATSEDEALREMATAALAQIGASAVSVLANLLAEEAHRSAAVCALARIRTAATIKPLLTVVEDRDGLIRSQAIEALGSFRDRRIPPVLVKALTDPVASVRLEAIATLGRRKDLAESFNLVEQLQARLWDLNPAVCTQAAIALGRLGTPAAGEALYQVLSRPHTPEPLQTEIVKALGWISSERTVANLIAAFGTASATVQPEILRALANVKETALKTEVVDVLMVWLSQPQLTEASQQALIMTLARLGDLRAISALIQQLAQPQKRIYLHAIAALKQLGAAAALRQMQQMQQQPDLPLDLKHGIQSALEEW
ncbi:HEAT repeat domain-containing protein [Sphaerothrix gracilis]|uniref:HEAT repeat domain-containing protein n=1 Tax=Sphaerothrix gracilis TaxID=3151835 RepID=UPI0031FBD008